MPALSLFLALAARFALGPSTHESLAPVVADTINAAADSGTFSRLTVVFGTAAPEVGIARGFDFTLSASASPPRRGVPGASAQVRYLRAPDSLSAELARRVTAGERYPRVEVTIERGTSVLLLHLHDVRVVSTHLHLNTDDADLAQQRLALQESIAQLAAQEAEARRQLAATEALARERLSAPLDLARVRSEADVIATRLAVQRRRLVLLDRQVASWMPAQEEVVLDAARAEVEVR